jgi:dethiobiotin synthetase
VTPPVRRKGLFVTGTDTGVGKTVVACALVRLALARARRLIPFKPVETGCAPDPSDALALWEAARRPVPRDAVCLYPLALPAAPAVAAAAANQLIDFDAIETRADELQAAGDALIIEGAGGLLVPYRGATTTADLATQLGLPLLVVARSALGTINHTALTLFEITRRQLPLAGLVLVQTTSDGTDPAENSNQIKILTGSASLGVLPHLAPGSDADKIAAALASAIGEHGLNHLFRQAGL